MRLNIYKPTLLIVLLFHAVCINLPYINGYGMIQYLFLLITGIFLLFRYRTFKRNPFHSVNIWMLFYIGMVIVSSYINRNAVTERQVLLVAIIFAVKIVEIFFLFEFFAIKGKFKELISTLFYLTLFYCVLSDITLLVFPNLHVQKGMYYLIGNKFELSYLHLQLLVLFLQRQKNKGVTSKAVGNNVLFITLGVLSLFICSKIDCSTGIIGVVLLFVFYFLNFEKKEQFKKPFTFFAILFIAASVLLLFSSIVTWEPIRYLIVDVLHKDITLTGRLNIYSKLHLVFNNHILLGYGLGSSYEVSMKLISGPNTQNGILEVILEQGVLSLGLLLIVVYKVFKFNSKNANFTYLILILYIYALFASIEITLNLSFITWLALLLVAKYTPLQKKERLEG